MSATLGEAAMGCSRRRARLRRHRRRSHAAGLDGLSMVKVGAGCRVRTPALFLTSLGGVDDRVEGLEAGGDDYLVKPFAFSELLARINALGRRPAGQEQRTVLRVADLEMDLIKRQRTQAGQAIDLQPREFSLLEVLMRGEGRVITRTMLLEQVWDFHFDPKTSVVETHISRLRAKIDRPSRRRCSTPSATPDTACMPHCAPV